MSQEEEAYNIRMHRSVSDFWVNGQYYTHFPNFVECFLFEENFTAEHMEHFADAKRAYNSLQRFSHDYGRAFQCERVPFTIDHSDQTARDMPFFNAKPVPVIQEMYAPFSALEIASADMIQTLGTTDLVSLDTMFYNFRERGLKVKCGLNGFRRVYRFEDVILAYIFDAVGEFNIGGFIDLDDILINPKPYCRQSQLRMFPMIESKGHCELCAFSKATRLSSSIFEMPGHLDGCTGDSPSYLRTPEVCAITDNINENWDEPLDEIMNNDDYWVHRYY